MLPPGAKDVKPRCGKQTPGSRFQGIVETSLYVDDLPASRSFYVLGLRLLAADEVTCVFAAGSSQTRDFQVVFLANAGFSLGVLAISWLTIERPGRAGQTKVVGG